MLSTAFFNVMLLHVIMLRVVMVDVAILSYVAPQKQLEDL
jgi:hypothetical protein